VLPRATPAVCDGLNGGVAATNTVSVAMTVMSCDSNPVRVLEPESCVFVRVSKVLSDVRVDRMEEPVTKVRKADDLVGCIPVEVILVKLPMPVLLGVESVGKGEEILDVVVGAYELFVGNIVKAVLD